LHYFFVFPPFGPFSGSDVFFWGYLASSFSVMFSGEEDRLSRPVHPAFSSVPALESPPVFPYQLPPHLPPSDVSWGCFVAAWIYTEEPILVLGENVFCSALFFSDMSVLSSMVSAGIDAILGPGPVEGFGPLLLPLVFEEATNFLWEPAYVNPLESCVTVFLSSIDTVSFLTSPFPFLSRTRNSTNPFFSFPPKPMSSSLSVFFSFFSLYFLLLFF